MHLHHEDARDRGSAVRDAHIQRSPNTRISLLATWAGSVPADYVFTLPYVSGYDPAINAPVTGSSPFTVSFIASGGDSWGDFSYLGIASRLVTMNSDVTVKYSYFGEQVPVPVHATVALLGIGLVGIGTARRKQA